MTEDWIVRENHPFDHGYWARFDGMRRPGTFRFVAGATRPIDPAEQAGWDVCDAELRLERAAHK
jgi:hypothetical protein